MKNNLHKTKKALRDKIASGENTEEEKRPEIITKIFEMKRPKRNQEVDDCPITEDMMKLLGDICTEDQLAAMRLLCVDQFAPLLEKNVRQEFL